MKLSPDVVLDTLATRNSNMKQRRVVNAANARDLQDYVTLNDLQTRLAPSAYTDTTNASNITKGSLTISRVPTSWVTQVQDVTATRALGSVYSNRNQFPIWIGVTVAVYFSGGFAGLISVKCDLTATPAAIIMQAANSGTAAIYVPINFIVLPGYNYKLTLDSGSGTIQKWMEWT